MSETRVTRVASIKEFVSRLSTKAPDDIEKLLLHLLDISVNLWNGRSNRYLREMRQENLSDDRVKELRHKHRESFANVQRLLTMRKNIARRY